MNERIQNLSAGLVLISLDVLELGFRDDLILTEANTVVGIVTVGVVVVVFTADGNIAVLDDLSTGFQRESQILQVTYLIGVLDLATIPEIKASVGKEIGSGSDEAVGHVIIGRLIGGEYRSKDGEKHQNSNDTGGYNSALILAETLESTLEVADGLGLEFAVMKEVLLLSKSELFYGNICVVFFHNYFAPILILGSMKP
jgi:hypothetical protein